MDTAQHKPAAPRCLIFLHPAVAGNPEVVRSIHAATGLVAVVGLNTHAAELISIEPPPEGPWDGGSAA